MVATESDSRNRVWSRLLKTMPPVRVQSLRIIESKIFEEQIIEFDSVNCVVGSHGSGKTLLLRLIEAAFGYSSHTPPFVGGSRQFEFDPEPVAGVVELVISVGGEKEIRQVVDLSLSERDRAEIWARKLSPNFWPAFASSAELANNFIWYYQQLPHSRDHVLHEHRFKAIELAALKAILGRRYESVLVQTLLLDEGLDDNSWYSQGPFVTAVTEIGETDSTKFSLGELWVHQALWEQRRLQAGCLFMLDEPESFLALRGHRAFVDEVARRALEQKLQLVVATHSPQVLSRFPAANVRMCVRGSAGRIRVLVPSSLEQVNRVVGVEVPLTGTVLVEDAFAASVLGAIFGFLDFPSGSIEIVCAGGKDEVVAGVRILSNSSRLHVYGVLDADQRELAGKFEGLFSLPGELDPEQELLRFALRATDEVAVALGRSEDGLLAALDGYEFFDHQYWLGRLAAELGLDKGFLVNVLIRLWLQQEGIHSQAVELVAALAKGR
ncbi:ATP-binding protein [Micromonospora sp. CPM1]|uniref:ATP-binding protein n=1 Tax=Micromonospora sp. CPM1 TaxID=2944809 RepID=UPI00207D70B4|nr:ATP-binding protein [Micromonospora sp. CPM1]MCO1618778.1 ATP-binding protein [Micromonospora sp. CPM1]